MTRGGAARLECTFNASGTASAEPRRAASAGVRYDFARITVPASSVMPAGLPIGVFPVSFDLRPFGVSVTPGEVLALVVANPNTSFPYYGLWGSFTQPFSGGTAFNRAPSLGRPTFGAPGGNHAFATFVDTAATPEPATALLFGSALVPLVASARRKSVTKSLQ